MIRIIKFVVFALAMLVVTIAGYKAVNYKLETLKTARMEASTITASMRQKQLDCLARNIYYEAGNQPFEGKVAVAQVTINRAESGQFPKDICQVVYQKNVVYERVLCQFSWYCETATMMRPKNTAVFKESEMVARQVLLEGFRLPSLQKALYFHATHINPKWNRERVAIIAGHVFYK